MSRDMEPHLQPRVPLRPHDVSNPLDFPELAYDSVYYDQMSDAYMDASSPEKSNLYNPNVGQRQHYQQAAMNAYAKQSHGQFSSMPPVVPTSSVPGQMHDFESSNNSTNYSAPAAAPGFYPPVQGGQLPTAPQFYIPQQNPPGYLDQAQTPSHQPNPRANPEAMAKIRKTKAGGNRRKADARNSRSSRRSNSTISNSSAPGSANGPRLPPGSTVSYPVAPPDPAMLLECLRIVSRQFGMPPQVVLGPDGKEQLSYERLEQHLQHENARSHNNEAAPERPFNAVPGDEQIARFYRNYQHEYKRNRKSEQAEPGVFVCTFGCGWSHNTKANWKRHERTHYPQEIWLCRHPKCASKNEKKRVSLRADLLRRHHREHHKGEGELTDQQLEDCCINVPDSSFPRECVYLHCGHRFSSFEDRLSHHAIHLGNFDKTPWRKVHQKEPSTDSAQLATPEWPAEGEKKRGKRNVKKLKQKEEDTDDSESADESSEDDDNDNNPGPSGAGASGNSTGNGHGGLPPPGFGSWEAGASENNYSSCPSPSGYLNAMMTLGDASEDELEKAISTPKSFELASSLAPKTLTKAVTKYVQRKAASSLKFIQQHRIDQLGILKREIRMMQTYFLHRQSLFRDIPDPENIAAPSILHTLGSTAAVKYLESNISSPVCNAEVSEELDDRDVTTSNESESISDDDLMSKTESRQPSEKSSWLDISVEELADANLSVPDLTATSPSISDDDNFSISRCASVGGPQIAALAVEHHKRDLTKYKPQILVSMEPLNDWDPN